MLDGNQQKQGEKGPSRTPEQTHPVGVKRIGPLGHRDAHRLCPHTGQGPRSASTGHCRAWLGPASSWRPPFHKCRHIPLALQDVPQAVASCIPPCPERKCLHKSTAGPLTELLYSDPPNLQVSHPPPAPPKILGDFSQTYPKTAMLLPGTSSAGPKEKARHAFHPEDSTRVRS